jgi:hypothetical protein
MPKYEKGQTIHARGRDWIVEIPPEGETDILIANPLFNDDDYKRIEVVSKAWERRQKIILSGVFAQRDVICLEEIAA